MVLKHSTHMLWVPCEIRLQCEWKMIHVWSTFQFTCNMRCVEWNITTTCYTSDLFLLRGRARKYSSWIGFFDSYTCVWQLLSCTIQSQARQNVCVALPCRVVYIVKRWHLFENMYRIHFKLAEDLLGESKNQRYNETKHFQDAIYMSLQEAYEVFTDLIPWRGPPAVRVYLHLEATTLCILVKARDTGIRATEHQVWSVKSGSR